MCFLDLVLIFELIFLYCRMHELVNRFSIGSDNGLSPIRYQTIINWTLRNKLLRNYDQNTKLFIQENASENIVCEMAPILSRGDELTGSWNLLFIGSPW